MLGSKKGQHKTALVVSPTHREGANVTKVIREGLKEQKRLKGPERAFTRLVNTQWTEAERSNSRFYEKGQVVKFHQNAKGFKRGERLEVAFVGKRPNEQTGQLEMAVQFTDGRHLPLNQAKRFQVYQQQEIALCKGDRIRITEGGLIKRKGKNPSAE